MPPLASGGAIDQSTLDSLMTGGGGKGAPGGAPGGNAQSAEQVRAKIEQAVAQVRDLSTKVDEIGKSIPGSEQVTDSIKKQLRKLAQLAATAGAQQNGSADALPS